MNRRTTIVAAMCAALLMAFTPNAQADVGYTPIPGPYDFGVGLLNPADPGGALNSAYDPDAEASDTLVLTFAAHMVSIFYNVESLHFNFVYDNSGIEVLGARPVNPGGSPTWLSNNYDTFTWPNPSSGFVSVSTLFQSMGGGTTFQPMNTTSIVPFFQVTLHVKDDVQDSAVYGFGISQMTLVSHTFALSLSPAAFNYFGGALHAVGGDEACCLPDGSCAVLDPTVCTDQGGAPQGPGTDCTTPICPAQIPTVSEWGLIVLGLLLLTGGTIVIRRERAKARLAA